MSNHERRLRSIELTRTPQQVVVSWLMGAQQAGTFEAAGRRLPPPRRAIANEISKIVETRMKGELEPVMERAIMQARQEADALFMLVIDANTAVSEETLHRRRDLALLGGYLHAVARSPKSTENVEELRVEVLRFVENVFVLEAAIGRIARERLSGQPVLFRDTSHKLEQQLQMVSILAKFFNLVAQRAGAAELTAETVLRNSIYSQVDKRVLQWEGLARLEMLQAFGSEDACLAAAEQLFPLVESRS
jgi:hypothetical protein